MTPIVSVSDLTFGYKKDPIIHKVSFDIPEGSIFGFVGPNGAGKSTTIKLLLDLLTPESGTIKIFGKEYSSHRKEILKKIGSLVEVPSLYPHLTAEENIEVVRKIHGAPLARTDEVLQQTGIADAKSKRVKEFSLGMKQRLGIALSLLHSPQLLILDEPINGLDPQGIQEFRIFLKHLSSDYGVTILLSSHILAELEQVITDIGVISKGEMKFVGTLDEFKKKKEGVISIEVSDPLLAKEALRAMDICISNDGVNTLVVQNADKEFGSVINKALVNAGIEVYQLKYEQPNLETIFFELLQAGNTK